MTRSLEETSVDLSVGNFGSITVTFNQLFKDFTAGGQTPAAVSMEQFTLLLLITPGSIARWHDVDSDDMAVSLQLLGLLSTSVSTYISALAQGYVNFWWTPGFC